MYCEYHYNYSGYTKTTSLKVECILYEFNYTNEVDWNVLLMLNNSFRRVVT